MKLPKVLRQQVLEKVQRLAHRRIQRSSDSPCLEEAHRQGRLSEAVEEMLTPFLAELTLGECTKILSMGRRYARCGSEERRRIESRMRELARGVAERAPERNAEIEPLLNTLGVLLMTE